MTTRKALFLVVTTAAIFAPASQAQACFRVPWWDVPQNPIRLPAGEAPPRVEPNPFRIKRGFSTMALGCFTSCDSEGLIRIEPRLPGSPHDPARFSYQFALLSGTLPDGLRLPALPVAPVGCSDAEDPRREFPCINLSWEDGFRNDQDPFSFMVSIRAVDGQGRMGPTTTFALAQDGTVVIPPNPCPPTVDSGPRGSVPDRGDAAAATDLAAVSDRPTVADEQAGPADNGLPSQGLTSATDAATATDAPRATDAGAPASSAEHRSASSRGCNVAASTGRAGDALVLPAVLVAAAWLSRRRATRR